MRLRNVFTSTKIPTPAQLKKAGLVALTTQAEMKACLDSGKPLRTFNGTAFPELTEGVYGPITKSTPNLASESEWGSHRWP